MPYSHSKNRDFCKRGYLDFGESGYYDYGSVSLASPGVSRL